MPAKARIEVEPAGSERFRVRVAEPGSESVHEVEAKGDEVRRLGAGASPETLVAESFRFLLEREPKEAILPRFSLSVIARYFPEYPEEIQRRLAER